MQQPTIQSSWVDGLVETFTTRELHKKALIGWPPIDESLDVLEQLERRGYQEVRWRSANAQCFTCNDLNDQVWPISEFLYFTKHDAPIFSKSHCNCRCTLLVTGVDSGTGVQLDPQIVVAY